jgi:hypothetical protein
MKTYFIGYDLKNPGQNYTDLIEAIKKLGSYWHCLDSTWLIKSNSTAIEIRDYLIKHIDKNDKILVAQISGDGAWKGFDKTCADWLKNNWQ